MAMDADKFFLKPEQVEAPMIDIFQSGVIDHNL